jgi:hypothetical protein
MRPPSLRRSRPLRDRWIASLLSIAMLASASSFASAAPVKPTGPSPKEIEAAHKAFSEGIELEGKEQWGDARAKFEEVAKVVRMTPAIRFHIALCEEHEGKLVQALKDFETAEADAKAEKVAQVAKEAPEHAAAIRVRLPKLTLVLPKGISDIEATLDGAKIDATATDGMVMDPGEHQVSVTASERVPFRQDLTLIEGEEKTLKISLEPIPKTVVDEPPPPQPLPPPPASKPPTVAFIVGGAGVAAIAVSGILFYKRSSAISDLQSACPSMQCTPDKSGEISSGKSYTTWGNIFGVVGVLGLGTGVVLFVTAPRSAKADAPADVAIRLVPHAAGADLGGLSLVGAF